MTDRKLSGSRARAAGSGFESALDLQHNLYERDRVAVINKNPTGARTFRKPDGSVGYALAPSLPDYSGAVYPGTGIFFDAKTSSNKSGWYLGKKKLHQAMNLSRLAGVGAFAFFLVESRVHERVYLLNMFGYNEIDEAPPKITWSQHEDQENKRGSRVLIVEPDPENGLYNYLSVISAFWLGDYRNIGLETH